MIHAVCQNNIFVFSSVLDFTVLIVLLISTTNLYVLRLGQGRKEFMLNKK